MKKTSAKTPSYWLMKSEPDVFSIDDLKRDKTSLWDGVRNYQARNFMLREMRLGDLALFYHSNASPPGIAGLARISRLAQPDPTQFDPKSEYYDPKSSQDNPRWHCVEVAFERKFDRLIPLDELRSHSTLKEMLVLKKGQRLSIQPVTRSEFNFILRLAGK